RGAGADVRVALSREDDFGHHGGEHFHWDGVHRRRCAARKTGGRVRSHRRGFWRRLRAGAGARWNSWERESAAAVLGGGRIESGELALRIFLCPGIAPARTAKRIHSAPCEPDRLARAPAFASGIIPARDGPI